MADFSFDTSETDPLISPVVFAGTSDATPQMVHVEFINLYPGKVFYKKQCRKNHVARQVVTDGVVQLNAKYSPSQLLRIRGWVRREPNAASLQEDRNGEVLICGPDNRELNLIKDNDMPRFTEDGYTLQPFSVDLGEIYEGPTQPVFELARADTEKRNLFQLIIQLVFVDGQTSRKFISPTFMCCTQKRKSEPPPANEEPPFQRQRQDSGGTNDACSPWSSGESGILDSSLRHKKILVDVLDAKTAHIGEIVCQKMSTTNADIAYHLRLRDPSLYETLEEGDIVGFYTDEESGDTYIQKLRSDNIHTAIHAGVISRSYWIDGNKPLTPETTDTVCIIGIVHVKVMGSIENGERIYASRDCPGKAIPQSHVPVSSFLRKKHVLLGMALEGKKNSKSLEEVHLIKCFVCIVLDVSRKELLEEIEELYEVNEKRTEEQIKLHSKKNWRRLKCCFSISLVILGILIFGLYQWLAPGSMFRYWLCRRESIPNHDLYFHFRTHRNWRLDVHAIQFEKSHLEDKVGREFNANNITNGTAYYYMNIDRCAYYWDVGSLGNNIGGHKYIDGSRILSVDQNCSTVYECIEDDKQCWKKVQIQEKPKCEPKPG